MLLQFQLFQDLYDALIELLLDKENRKDLESCGPSVHQLFESTLALTQDPTTVQWDQLLKRANALTDYCNEAILLHHFKLVPVYWRRMLMDAGLLQVLIQLRTLLTKKQSTDFQQLEPLVQKIMCDLDTCSVVSGSPGPQRRWIANTILDSLQTWLSNGRNCPPAAQAKPAKASNHDPLKYPIMRLVEPPSFEWFLAHCNADRPTPFIMPRGVIEHWPAFHQHPWHSMDYLLSVAADRVVPVEIGSQYTDHQWSQKMMRFADFIHHHIIQEQPTPAYLAQHDVFYQIPRLEQDIIVPDYCYIEPRLNDLYTAHTKDVIKNAWFGPKGTISPLHHDPYHNLLCQVVGSKYLKLISPQQSGLVYPREGLMSNTSQVDVQCPDNERFPLFQQVAYLECYLEEGEILYIPPKWWHFVQSLETSFSVSLWF